MAEISDSNSLGGRGKPAKWAVLLNDKVVAAPRQIVAAMVIRDQGGVPSDHVLIRDHNSPNDVVIEDDEQVDLAQGNVFYTVPRCDVQPRGECHEEPKLAFFADDNPEIATRRSQTGRSVRDLFAIPHHVQLVRDLESPEDVNIGLEASVEFSDGPVFYTRHVKGRLKITVNSQVFAEHDGVKPSMSGLQIAALVFPEKPSETSVRIISDGDRQLPLEETICINGGEVFEVVRKEVTGGFEASRVERELALLRTGGQDVTLVNDRVNAVVFYGLRVAAGEEVTTSDVLVLIPSGYPGQMIDGAYLPENSPLTNRVKGDPQDARVHALGQKWRLISYHPHQGGGAPAWNPTIHGFHTYLGELSSWLNNLR